MTVYIYGLVDPRTRQVRYVGRANDVDDRLCGHINGRSNQAVQSWLAELRLCGAAPQLVVLRECADDFAAAAERDEIQTRHRAGCPLLNIQGIPPNIDAARRAALHEGALYGDSAVATSRAVHALLNAKTIITQTAIGEAVGLSQPAVSNLISGKHEPTIRTAVKFRDVFGIEIEWWVQSRVAASDKEAA